MKTKPVQIVKSLSFGVRQTLAGSSFCHEEAQRPCKSHIVIIPVPASSSVCNAGTACLVRCHTGLVGAGVWHPVPQLDTTSQSSPSSPHCGYRSYHRSITASFTSALCTDVLMSSHFLFVLFSQQTLAAPHWGPGTEDKHSEWSCGLWMSLRVAWKP